MINKSTESIDPAALQMIERAKGEGLSTCFSRVDEIEPCPIGIGGGCCKVCFMGPCRLAIRQEGGKNGRLWGNPGHHSSKEFSQSYSWRLRCSRRSWS